MPEPKSPLRLASIAAAAKHADVNPKTIRRWLDAGLITAYRVGPRLIKIDLDELESSFHRMGGGVNV